MTRIIITPYTLKDIEQEYVDIFEKYGEDDKTQFGEKASGQDLMRKKQMLKILLKYVAPMYDKIRTERWINLFDDNRTPVNKTLSYEKLMTTNASIVHHECNTFNEDNLYGNANRVWLNRNHPAIARHLVDDESISIMAFLNEEFLEAVESADDYPIIDDDIYYEQERELQENARPDMISEVDVLLNRENISLDDTTLIDEAMSELENEGTIEWTIENDYGSPSVYIRDSSLKKVVQRVKEKLALTP